MKTIWPFSILLTLLLFLPIGGMENILPSEEKPALSDSQTIALDALEFAQVKFRHKKESRKFKNNEELKSSYDIQKNDFEALDEEENCIGFFGQDFRGPEIIRASYFCRFQSIESCALALAFHWGGDPIKLDANNSQEFSVPGESFPCETQNIFKLSQTKEDKAKGKLRLRGALQIKKHPDIGTDCGYASMKYEVVFNAENPKQHLWEFQYKLVHETNKSSKRDIRGKIICGAGTVALCPANRRLPENEVADIIKRGVGYLKSIQSKDGYFIEPGESDDDDDLAKSPGRTALVLHALLKAGVPHNDPAIQKGFAHILGIYKKCDVMKLKLKAYERTYHSGVLLQACNAYRVACIGKENPKLLDETKELGKVCLKNILENRTLELRNGTDKLWGDPGAASKGTDMSSNQFAILGLNAAFEMGIWNPDNDKDFHKTWKEIFGNLYAIQCDKENPAVTLGSLYLGHAEDREFECAKTQNPKGWGYWSIPDKLPENIRHEGTAAYGSMTAAGIASMVLAYNHHRESVNGNLLRKNIYQSATEAVNCGLAWFENYYLIWSNPKINSKSQRRFEGHYYYYLYSLERAGSLSGLQYFGKHDWYREGSLALMALQWSNGSWAAGGEMGGKPASTSFALLFLTQASKPPASSKD